MALQIGSRGPAVKELQLKLKAGGFDPGDIDGVFGARTAAALTRFQEQFDKLEDTGVFDDETAAALDQALVVRDRPSPEPAPDATPVPCAPEIWSAFLGLVDLVTQKPVRYGPGRGLFKDGAWIITHGPGALGQKSWKSHLGHSYPSFHCTSWTNFFLAWLLRYNERYTHAGNIPSLFQLLEQSDDLHQQAEGSPYRGYGPSVREIVSNGDSYPRTKVAKALDLRELYSRRTMLPTFLVCGQSTRTANGWNWWHHTVVFAIDHARPGAPMHRIAADGYRDARGYSGLSMQWSAIDPEALPRYDSVIYRAYGVHSEDGTYGGARPIAPVTFES